MYTCPLKYAYMYTLTYSLSLSLPSLSQRRLLPVQTNSPDRVDSNVHDPVFCSQVQRDSAFYRSVNIDQMESGQLNVTLLNGTAAFICPPATFRAAPPCVRPTSMHMCIYMCMHTCVHVQACL